MFSTTVICKQCGKPVAVFAESQASLHLRASKKRYCNECMKERMAKSNRESKKRRRKNSEIYFKINIREFDEGYERFWKKRGMEPPKVDMWGNYFVK